MIVIGPIAFIIILIYLCSGRKAAKATARNTAELVRFAKLPSHLRHMEQVEAMPRGQRRVYMRQECVAIYGEKAMKWSHSDVYAAFTAHYQGKPFVNHEALYQACLDD